MTDTPQRAPRTMRDGWTMAYHAETMRPLFFHLDAEKAAEFAAQTTGTDPDEITTVEAATDLVALCVGVGVVPWRINRLGVAVPYTSK